MFYETQHLSIRKAKGFAQQIEEKTKGVVTVNHTDPDFAYVFVHAVLHCTVGASGFIGDMGKLGNVLGLRLHG